MSWQNLEGIPSTLLGLIVGSLVGFFFLGNPATAEESVCFTPGDKCNLDLEKHIRDAQKSIYVQAYQLTSPTIINTLETAYSRRNIDVVVILDKSANRKYLNKQHVDFPIFTDYKPAIAHNKVMIFDNKIVETGSYNYTMNAETRNAENMVFLDNPRIVKEYVENFRNRLKESR